MPGEGHKEKWKREHAETKRKEVSEDQLVTSLPTFAITHRKCEEKVQEVGYCPGLLRAPVKSRLLLSPAPWALGGLRVCYGLFHEPGSYAREGSRSASRARC